MLGMFLSSLDQTIVSTSIYTIANDLDGLSLQAWATTAYLITATVTTPLYGKLSDIFGRRPLYLAAILIFLAGSLYAGSVHSMTELALARSVQGMGAGGLLALALTVIGDIVALKDRATYQGYFMSVFGISSVLGPVVGGAFAGSANILGFDGWRWVFFINLPIGLAALAVVFLYLHLPAKHVKQKIDYWGAAAITLAMQVSVPAKDMGVATSSAAFFRSMGGAVGTAVFISMLFSLAADKVAAGIRDAMQNADFLKVLKDPAVAADPANAQLYAFFKNGASNDSLNDTSWLHAANPTLARPITEAFAQSIDAVMLTAATLTGIAFLISFALPNKKLTDPKASPQTADAAPASAR
jgi:MFS family permease